ncbi:MAG TPA: ATP-binding cassette domain-containing protein [Candidatus Limiplasma pullicola]|nr:ATP-binding cassette domain-containing protein [Candidatus Limiplasma pullicola]
MDGFDGQLRARQKNDEALLEHAFANISDAVFGSRTADRFKTDAEKVKNAIDEILVYYHVGTREVPEEIQDLDEQLEYLLRPHSIMRKNVTLEKGWYRDSIGALLGTRKSDGRVVALLPAGMFGYVYRDERTGKPVRVTVRNQYQFDAQAIAFYKVFPLTRLNLPTLLRYIVQTISTSDYLMFALATLIVVLIGLLMPRLNNLLVGLVAQSASRKLLVSMAAFMACVSVSSLMFGAVKSLLMARIKLRMNLSVQAATMARILALPASFFKEYSSGELSSRASQVGKLCDMLASALLSTGLTSVFSLVYIGQIFLYAPALVRPALAIVLITVLFSLFTALLQMKISKRTMEVAAKENGMGYALLKGIEKIRLSGAETRAFARWMQVYSDKVRLTYHPPFLVKFNTTIALLISLAGTILMYEMAFVSGVSVADYYAFNTAYGMVSGAFLSLASIALTLAGCGPTLEMVKPFFDAVPEASEDKQIVTGLNGGIELDNICFRYDENMPNVLDNLTLKIEPGQYVAIVGATGCGKSTLMRLMLGFEKPQKGAVYYDGRDLESLDTKSLRKRIGVVMQNGKLFQGDIYSNIVIAAPWLTVDDAWDAAEMVGIAEDIRQMPMGMYTLISERAGISGGQKQRLLIARAIAARPRILMFDEATSALDSLAQKRISDALSKLQCTRVVIAHRLSTIRQCDRIVVLENGRIIEDGTYAELLEKRGFFAELVKRQRLDGPQDAPAGV